jgi:hypothetical protein
MRLSIVLLSLIGIALIACSTGPTEYTIEDVESAGFTITEDLTSTYDYPGLLSSLDGNINLDGKSDYVGVFIFDGKPDDFTKEQLKTLGLMVGSRVQFSKNIVIACHTEDVCKHLANNLK